jgi:hypothetical protein
MALSCGGGPFAFGVFMAMYRCYYNRASEAPLVWSIDAGWPESEVKVTEVRIVGCEVRTGVNLAEQDTENRPKVWMEVEGDLVIHDRIAYISSETRR